MPDRDVTIHAVWKQTVKSGTGPDEGRFLSEKGDTVTVSAADLRVYERATLGVEGVWSLTLDTMDIGSKGNLSVSMFPAAKNVMGSVSDRAVEVYSLILTDDGKQLERTGGQMTVEVPFTVPEGKGAKVWVMAGGDPVEAESEYSEGTLTFSTHYATYWAGGYVDLP